MLKINNLEKHYKSKQGPDHHALKDINLEFGDKGFVFVLGKSGSGKSTLLNILGGLDSFDSGDIQIKGKSSKDFKPKDWDSYRNTYVGFVFQEFNIIEEYTISKNIGLALELQGSKKNEVQVRVESILNTVELEGYGKRKPNELSGGQMQRIAIARALVKQPEIILADEPTGNLDSNTGKQIMETLQKLSKDKLVIMVSHDKESAEKYGDRIIELKDGKVISDIVSLEGEFIQKPSLLNVSTITPRNALYVPSGEKLAESHIEEINQVLADESIIYIPVSKKKLSENDIIKINHLLSEGDTVLPIIEKKQTNELKDNTSFRVPSNVENLARFKRSNGNFRLVKSVLPLKNTVRMAFLSIWKKKFKLIFSVILFLAAVGLFGFSETVTKFNIADASAVTYDQAGIEVISLGNSKEVIGWDRPEKTDAPFNISILTRFMSDFGYEYSLLYSFAKQGVTINSPSSLVEVGQLAGFFVIEDLGTFNLSLLSGSLPSSVHEIMLTDFVVDYYIEEELYTSYNDIIDASFKIEDNYYKISGVIDTDYESHLFLNDLPKSQLEDNLTEIGKYQNNLDSIYSRVFVIPGFYEVYENTFDGFSRYLSVQTPKIGSTDVWDTNHVTNELTTLDPDLVDSDFMSSFLFVPDDFKRLAEDEVIISIDSITSMFEISDHEMIRNLIYDARTNSENIYELLEERGYVNVEQTMSFVKDESWERVDEKTYKVVGAVDYGYYAQIKNIQLMLEFFEDENIDLDDYNINLDEMTENPWGLQGQLGGLYMYAMLESEGVEVILEHDYWPYLLASELEENNIDFLDEEEFYDEMIVLAETIRLFEEGTEVTPSVTSQFFFDRGYYLNIDDTNIDDAIKGYYDQYLNDLASNEGINPNFDYYGYIMSLARENNINVPDGNPDMWSPMMLPTNQYNEINPYDSTKPELIVVKLKDLESNKSFFATTELQGYVHKTTNGLILQTFGDFRDDAASIFRYVSIGLATFAAVLMFTNISASVLSNKKVIGTLRAIGAKGSDVAKIFIIEALFIGVFTTVLAIIGLQIGTMQLNASLTDQLGMDISLFNSSWIVALEMLGLSLVVVLIAAFLPVKGVSMMKPINAIKNK